jgi:hypothetical protein
MVKVRSVQRTIRRSPWAPVCSGILILATLAELPAAALAQTPPAPRPITPSPAPPPPPPTPVAIDSTAKVVPASQSCASGERDAQDVHNSTGFLIAGALTGPIALGVAAMKSPQPRGERLAGMAPENAAEYARCYGRRAQKKNLKSALNGFAVGAFLYAAAFYYTDSKTAP